MDAIAAYEDAIAIVEASNLRDYLPELQKSLSRCIEARDAKGNGKNRKNGRGGIGSNNNGDSDGVMTEEALREIMAADDASASIFKGNLQVTSKTKNVLQSVGEAGESEEDDSDGLGQNKRGIHWGLSKNETKSVHDVDKMIRASVGSNGDDEEADANEANVDTTLNCRGVSVFDV
jgi:Arc/MetJ family transcription regulator